jgi:protocatechuate 3,4-dioxygenase beta subunit
MVPAVMWISGMVSNAHPGNPDDLPGRDAPSSLVLAPAEEPGSPLLVRGRIYAPDGQTPVEGVVLYVYQTGADGRYAPPGERTPRLRGWVRTDEEGRYAYRTVRPGPYPGRSIPAHIHAVLWGGGYPPQWGGDILFEDDPLVDSGERRASREAERFAHVCSPLATEEGELSCTRNYRLKPGADPVSDEIAHAFQGPVED